MEIDMFLSLQNSLRFIAFLAFATTAFYFSSQASAADYYSIHVAHNYLSKTYSNSSPTRKYRNPSIESYGYGSLQYSVKSPNHCRDHHHSHPYSHKSVTKKPYYSPNYKYNRGY